MSLDEHDMQADQSIAELFATKQKSGATDFAPRFAPCFAV
jgi:hypothetical protein